MIKKISAGYYRTHRGTDIFKLDKTWIVRNEERAIYERLSSYKEAREYVKIYQL